MGKYVIFFCFLIISGTYSQVNLDSIYTEEELNDLLREARINYTNKKEKTQKDELRLADAYFLLAKFEEDKFNNRKSFDFYTQSLNYYRIAGDTVQINRINTSIAKRYKEAGLITESEDLYKEVLEYYQKNGDLYNQAKVLFQLSDLYKGRLDAEQEKNYLDRAILINEELKDTSLLLTFLVEKIGNYQRLNEIDSALLVAFQTFTISDEFQDQKKISESLFAIGNLNQIKLDYEKAIKYMSKGLELRGEEPYDEFRRKIYKSLSEVYSRVGEYKMAYEYETKFSDLNNQILQKKRQEALDNEAIKHNVIQTKKDLSLLEFENKLKDESNKNQKRALYIMAAGLTLLLLLIYYLVRFYTQKIRTEKIISSQVEEINNQQIRELEDNMKINSMQSMIEGQEIERERIARDLHDSLGGLLSTIKLQFDSVGSKDKQVHNIREFQKANKLLDTAVTEVRAISHNLQPGALMNLGLVPAIKDLINRFDADNSPEIDFQVYRLPEKMDNMVVLSIYRIVQELFHNALKHSQASEILLQINCEKNEIIIQFEDDGIGFKLNDLKSKGMGLANIQSRINYLKGSLEIDSTPGEGTSYLLHFKYK